MKIASAQFKPYCRRLIEPLRTAHGLITERRGFIIALKSDEGHTGFGEIPLPLFTEADQSDSVKADDYALMKASVESLVGKDIPSSLEDAEVDIEHIFAAEDPFIYFGLETALCDLAGKIGDHPLSQWLSADARTSISVNYLIRRPVDDWDAIAAYIAEHGYRAVKAKVAIESIDDDIRFIETLRNRLGQDIAIRLDANRGWDFDRASGALNRMARFGIDYIEEPLTAFDPDSLRKLRAEAAIPIALDETLTEIDDIDDLLSAKITDVLILKPALIGGMARTVDLIRRAAKYDCRCVITTNLETEFGTAAIMHLAAAVPGDLPPCGLDTMCLFQNADPLLTKVTDGAIKIPSGAGLGVGEELWARL